MTTKVKVGHTPGPWHYDGPFVEGGTPTAIMNATERTQVASVRVHEWSILGESETISYEVADANARLIAAAPEMLTALEDVQDLAVKMANGLDMNTDEAFDEIIGVVSEAIRKAKGEL